MIFKSKKQHFFWCPHHCAYEKIKKDSNITEKGCKVGTLKAVIAHNPTVVLPICKHASFMWEASQEDANGYVEVAVYAVKVRTRKEFIWRRFSNDFVPEVTIEKFYNHYYMDGKNFECHPIKKYNWNLESVGIKVDENPKVYHAAVSGMLGAIADKYEINPLIPEDVEYSFSSVWNFIRRPYDYHVTFLRKFIGEDFNRLFPVENRNNYDKLCYYLDIKPPKSVRKEYVRDPYVLIRYYMCIRAGFEDFNAIRVFLTEKAFSWYMPKAVYDYRFNELRRHMQVSEADFRFFVRWLKGEGKDEMSMARQLITSLDTSEAIEAELLWEREADIIEILRRWFHIGKTADGLSIEYFHSFYPTLSDETKALAKRRGPCKDLLESIRYDIRKSSIVKKEIKYKKHVLELDDEVDGVEYRVVTNTMMLPDIGRALSNCVATYCLDAIEGRCIIVYGKMDDKYVMCIELRPIKENGETVQLGYYQILGRFNKTLKGHLLKSCREWVDRHDLVKQCPHLD